MSQDANPVEEGTYASKMIGKLREHIENGQLNIGAGGPGSNNALVNPIRAAAAAAQKAAKNPPPEPTSVDSTSGTNSTKSYHIEKEHALAAKAHFAKVQKKKALEDTRHQKERDDKLTRYLALIIAVIVIILSLLGMSAISRRAIGKWWHGQPDPLEPNPNLPSDKIPHSPLFFTSTQTQ